MALDGLRRREVLQRMAIGLGAVVSGCGGGGDGSGTAATSATRTPTRVPSATPSANGASTATRTPTDAAMRTATPSATSVASAASGASPTPTVTPPDIACVLTPEQVLGPYFIDVGLARSDVREDRTGVPLRLALQLVDSDGCTPIRDAVVNIWHADAEGIYSGFAGQPGGVDTTGETYLRGFQLTDAEGRVEFTTVYPGWYDGRTVHIHVRVNLDASTVLVTQLYFPESVTDAVYATEPYSSRPDRDTTNDEDGVAGSSLDELLLELSAESDGYVGSIVFGVDL